MAIENAKDWDKFTRHQSERVEDRIYHQQAHIDQLVIENYLRNNSVGCEFTGDTMKYNIDGRWFDYRGPCKGGE